MKKTLLGLFIVLMSSSCASYRTNSEITFNSTEVPKYQGNTKIFTNRPKHKYTELGPIFAEVKKLTILTDAPTKEQVNYVLIKKAESMKADGIIDVKYENGLGFTTWGFISATGTAIKFVD